MLSKSLTKKIVAAFSKESLVEYNSDRDCCYFRLKLGKDLEEAKNKLREYQEVNVNGVIWELKASFHWCSQMPVYFYGSLKK